MGMATLHTTPQTDPEAVEALREKIRFVADVLCAYAGLCDEMYTRIFADPVLGLGSNPADDEGGFTVTVTGEIGGVSFEAVREDVEAYTQRGADLSVLNEMNVPNPIPEWDGVDRPAATPGIPGVLDRMRERLFVHAQYTQERGSLMARELNRYLAYMGAQTLRAQRTFTFTAELPTPARVVQYSTTGFTEEEARRVAQEHVAADDLRISRGMRRINGQTLTEERLAQATPLGDAPLVFKSVE